MRFRLWGTRGSIPSPIRKEEIEAKLQTALSSAADAGVDLSDPAAIRAFIASLPMAIRGTAGGDTSCLELRSAGNLLIFDCGSGMRRLGMELMKEEFGQGQGTAHIFMCHTHWDHMLGWPFFNPGYVAGNRFIIYGVHPDLEERFRLQQTAPSMFPIALDSQSSEIRFVTLQEGETTHIGQTRVSNVRFHHPGDSYGYRVEDGDGVFVYAGDSEYKTLDPAATQRFVEFFRDADVLVFDAMFSLHDSYYFENWGHSAALAGADLATRAGVRRLLLFHHAPASTDEEIWNLRNEAKEYVKQHTDRPACEVFVAYDGFEMELWREATLDARWEHLPEGITIHLSGRLVGDTSAVALATIEQASARSKGQPLVVNLEAVTHLDLDGLKALFSARRQWCPLALCGLAPNLRSTLVQAGALDYFATFDTPSSALSALGNQLVLRTDRVLSDRYKIGEQFGRGPLGKLYLATDQVTRRQVNVLAICPSLGPLPAKALVEGAQGSARLRHPLIADVYGAGQDGQITYLVTEYTPGRSIRDLLASGPADGAAASRSPGSTTTDAKATPLAPAHAVRISSQIAEALEYIHGRNAVHGALCPENVILLKDGSIKLTNSGIGRLKIDKPLAELPAYTTSLDYLAPEQLLGQSDSPSSDLYALGVMLYEMLTGQLPIALIDGDEDLASVQVRQPPVPPRRRNPGLSRSLEHLVLNLMHALPQVRYRRASVVRQVLTNLGPQRQNRPLQGRDTLRRKLGHHVDRVAQGQSGVLVLRGPRGIGKSHLALSFAGQPVGSHPLFTLHGELCAYEDGRPYRLFVAALRSSLKQLPAHQLLGLFNDLGDLSRPLTALMPELESARPAFVRAGTECEQLEEAVCEVFRLLTTEGPVMLILDGLQWIDAASLRLLERLARQRIPRLLIVTLYRSEQVDQDHPLRGVLDALESFVDETLGVTPLGPVEVHQMASAINSPVPTDFGLWLFGETDGNPLYVKQLIEAYLAGPGETRQPYERAMRTTLEDVILRRLERMPGGAIVTLRQAAVLGQTFRFEELRAALDQPESQVLANLDIALQTSLVQGDPVTDQYRFSHPLIREVMYTEMLAGVRKRYHLRAAHVLEQGGTPGPLDERIDALAHHFLHAEEHEKAVAYLARATRRARQLCAYDVALGYIDQALAVVERLSRTATTDREREQRRKQRHDLLNARTRLEATLAQTAQTPS